MIRVFLSYARRDGSAAATRLREELERAGITVWRDIEEMRGGEDWKEQIRSQLRETDALLVLLTPGAVESKTVNWEWETALALKARVIPLLIQPCVIPAELNRLHCHPLRTPEEYALGLMALIRDLHELARPPPGAESAPPREPGSTFHIYGATGSAIGPGATVINNPSAQPQTAPPAPAPSGGTTKKPA